VSAAVAAPPVALLHTPLYPFHTAHGAHLVPFAGWEMPLYYSSIVAEHEAVRAKLGLFDVSHMGILGVSGGHAAALLSRRTTANVAKLVPGQCRYTFLLDLNGQIVDDLLITRIDDGQETIPRYLVVPNAARTEKVFDLFRQHRLPDTEIERFNGQVAILALQGHAAREVLEPKFGWQLGALKFYHGALFPTDSTAALPPTGRARATFPEDLEHAIWVSRTGYTGEPGYELFVRGSDAPNLAESLVTAGAAPCGLGARDTLRLEKGYLLSGQDFHQDHTPLEAGQEKFVEFDHPFVGRDALEKQKAAGVPVRFVGISVDEPGAIPRHGTPIFVGDHSVGIATSGGPSPILKHGLALGYLPTPIAQPGTEVSLDIRGRKVAGRVVELPFVPANRGRR
jgi:aminomethyltransferase